MINYTLKCAAGHSFDSWFQSAAAFDTLLGAGQVTCPHCGTESVKKAIMAPRLVKGAQRGGDVATPSGAADTQAVPEHSGPSPEVRQQMRQAMAALRRKVEENSDYVGDRFASEARAMHLGDKPARAIHGEARPDQARALIEDGVPVLPLPFGPKRKLN